MFFLIRKYNAKKGGISIAMKNKIRNFDYEITLIYLCKGE